MSSPPPPQPPQSPQQPPQSPQQPPQSPQPQPQTPPSPPTATPILPPPIIQALSYSPLKKPQPIPWSHEETLNLIKAYQEKWYSLKRGQLKASQWEEVAVTVAARCGLDEPSKSGTQCRHKIEKLRKRYRAEKLKLPPSFNYHNHPWIYFSLMDHLERGPLPISAVAPPKDNDFLDSDDDGNPKFASLRDFDDKRVDGYLRTGDFGNGHRRGTGFDGGNLRDLKKRKCYWEGNEQDYDDEEDDNGLEEDEEAEAEADEGERKGGGLMGELAAEMRGFTERMVRLERRKMELMRENERFRMEMENKRMEMILLSQQKTVDLISKAFAVSSDSQNKIKISPDLRSQ